MFLELRNGLRASLATLQLARLFQLKSVQFRGDSHLYPQQYNSLNYTSNQSQVKELAYPIIYYDDLLIPREYTMCRGISDPFKYGLFGGRK